MKCSSVSVFAIAFFCAAPCLAQSTWAPSYAEADIGAVLGGHFEAHGSDTLLGPVAFNEPLRRGAMASLLVGRSFGASPLALEAEGLYLNDAIKSDDLNALLRTSAGLRVQTYGALAGVKLETPVGWKLGSFNLAPYVGAGIGYGASSVTILRDHYDGDGLLWQAKAGVALKTSPRLAWTVGYRYLRLPTFDTNKLGLAARLQSDAHVVSVGVRYAFGPGA